MGLVLMLSGVIFASVLVTNRSLQAQTVAGGSGAPAPIVAQQLKTTVNSGEKAITGIPAQLDIDAIGMDLAVKNGEYNETTRQWTLGDDAAFYAAPTSPLSSAPANTLIYGHNTSMVFSSLFSLQKGNKAVVKADNGYEFIYTFSHSKTIEPTDTSVLMTGSASQLTLQTCTGWFDQYRQVFVFYLQEYRKSA